MYEVTSDTSNKDIPMGMDLNDAKEYYLEMYGDFDSKLPPPAFYATEERDDIFVLDFSLTPDMKPAPCGLKAHGAEKYIAETKKQLLGYAAPRVGHAAEAIAYLCELYGKTPRFFAAASKQVTGHQAVVLGYKGSTLRFAKIPAMTTLNAWIRGWAKKFDGIALPFGLADTPVVTAGLVRLCDRHAKAHGEPSEFWCAVSTGTMTRALQIGWPGAKANGVAVARNIKPGDIGESNVTSYHKTFYADSDYQPAFNTTTNYDAKAYKRFIDEAAPGAVFINVGSDEQIEHKLCDAGDWQNIDGIREWGDLAAFEVE
jgi:hypothetical protein